MSVHGRRVDLITALARDPRGRLLLAVPIAIYLGFNAQVFVRAALPLEPPLGASFPWGMFKDPSAEDRKIVATGVDTEGRAHDIPLEEVFRYRRGGTDLAVPDHVRALRKDQGAYPVTRKQLALFLADWMRDHRGVTLVSVTLKQRRTHIDTGRVRWRAFGTFDVTARDVPTPWTSTDL